MTLDQRKAKVSARGASARTTGLVIELADGSRITAAQAQTAISGGVLGGLLSGRGQTVRSSGLVETRIVVITAIRSQANVVRNGTQFTRTAKGTSIGSLTINGADTPLPAPGETLAIEGIASITPQVVHRTPHGITVVGLRVNLVGGETLDISQSTAHIADH